MTSMTSLYSSLFLLSWTCDVGVSLAGDRAKVRILKALAATCAQLSCQLLAYVVLDDALHLVVERGGGSQGEDPQDGQA